MTPEKQAALEAAGYRVGNADDFLGLNDDDIVAVSSVGREISHREMKFLLIVCQMGEYKGFSATFRDDPEAGVIRGRVKDIDDIITFYGKTREELESAFHMVVDEYLKFGEEIGA